MSWSPIELCPKRYFTHRHADYLVQFKCKDLSSPLVELHLLCNLHFGNCFIFSSCWMKETEWGLLLYSIVWYIKMGSLTSYWFTHIVLTKSMKTSYFHVSTFHLIQSANVNNHLSMFCKCKYDASLSKQNNTTALLCLYMLTVSKCRITTAGLQLQTFYCWNTPLD